MLKRYLRIISIGVGLFVFCFTIFYVLNDMRKEKQAQEDRLSLIRQSDYDTSYYSAKSIASKATELLAIRDKDSFVNKANLYKEYMAEDLWDSYFSTMGEGMLKRDIRIENKVVKGHIFRKGEYLFKIDSELTNASVLTEITIYVRVDNGIITQLYTQ